MLVKPWTGVFLSLLTLPNAQILGGRPSTPAQSLAADAVSSLEQCSEGLLPDTSCDVKALFALNEALMKPLSELVKTPYFRYYKVDLFKDCPFWHENGFCMNRDCGVEVADERDIPLKWRADALGSLVVPDMAGECDKDAHEFCYLDDSLTGPASGEHIDLLANPERFTGYAGPSAHRVWGAIYNENCFGIPGRAEGVETKMPLGAISGAGGDEDSEVCLEKRVYWRLISGWKASKRNLQLS